MIFTSSWVPLFYFLCISSLPSEGRAICPFNPFTFAFFERWGVHAWTCWVSDLPEPREMWLKPLRLTWVQDLRDGPSSGWKQLHMLMVSTRSVETQTDHLVGLNLLQDIFKTPTFLHWLYGNVGSYFRRTGSPLLELSDSDTGNF